MEAYLIPIKTAVLVFPLVAAAFTLPYMIYQYRTYGAIPPVKTVILYAFLFYLTCMYCLVILPLPTIREVEAYTTPTTQMIPFRFVADFIRETKFVLTDPSTWIPALTQNCFLQVLFNILLFIPMGIYLRWYFQMDWKETLLIGFLISLFLEYTQLSGLYGIYPRGYRLFDVDDLMLNTLGGGLGFAAAPFLTRFLPSRKQVDAVAASRNRVVRPSAVPGHGVENAGCA